MFISARVESLAQVLGSNLELGNVEAHEAATQAVVVIVVSLLAWLLSVVAAFIGRGKSAK
jgi:CHASE3 domain sensor protein